jgi:hypothetical protein
MSDRPARTPLSVLLASMHFWAARADAIGAQLTAIDGSDPDGAHRAAELLGEFIDAQQRATAAAAACAPFIHGRVSPTAAPLPTPDVSGDVAILQSGKASQNEMAAAYLRIMGTPLPELLAPRPPATSALSPALPELAPDSLATEPVPPAAAAPEPEPPSADAAPEPEPPSPEPEPPSPERKPPEREPPRLRRPWRHPGREALIETGAVDLYTLIGQMHGHNFTR